MDDSQVLTINAGVDAGGFAAWLKSMRAVLRGESDADVPCGECVGCCISSYPIPLRPTDRVALERVPPEYLHLPVAPGQLARMGFREDGTCPMQCAGKCAIYQDRPQTCRDYDCRIYAATGLLPDGDRPVIRQRVKAWKFEFESDEARVSAAAVQRAASFIQSHAHQFPAAMRAGSATAAAVLALKCHELFHEEICLPAEEEKQSLAQRVIDAVRDFDVSCRSIEADR